MAEDGGIVERRESERQRGRFPCQVVVQEQTFEGTTRNLSLGGVLFTPDGDFPKDLIHQEAMVTVVIDESPYDATCEVVRVADSGVGLRFIDLSATSFEEAILDFINGQLDDL